MLIGNYTTSPPCADASFTYMRSIQLLEYTSIAYPFNFVIKEYGNVYIEYTPPASKAGFKLKVQIKAILDQNGEYDD